METTVFTRKELYNLVWSKPMITIAKKYEISDNGLRKICKRMEIPIPKLGYWNKKKYHKSVKKIHLRKGFIGQDTISLILRSEEEKNSIPIENPIKLIEMEIENDLGSKLKVPERLLKPDPLITKYQEYLIARKKSNYYDTNFEKFRERLNINVEGELINRALIFLDTFIKAIKLRGHEIKVTFMETLIIIDDEEFKISIREKKKRVENKDKPIWNNYEYLNTGILVFQYYIHAYKYKEWIDGKRPLEMQISNIIAYLELESENIKTEREERRIQNEKEEIERKEVEALKQRKQKELKDFKNLLKDAKRWKNLKYLRNYIAFIENTINQGLNSDSYNKEWLNWAKAKADWYDPSVNAYDELLAEFDRNEL